MGCVCNDNSSFRPASRFNFYDLICIALIQRGIFCVEAKENVIHQKGKEYDLSYIFLSATVNFSYYFQISISLKMADEFGHFLAKPLVLLLSFYVSGQIFTNYIGFFPSICHSMKIVDL